MKINRSVQGLRLEIATLESELLDQERCHVEQVSTLENERRLREAECDALRRQFQEKLAEMARQ